MARPFELGRDLIVYENDENVNPLRCPLCDTVNPRGSGSDVHRTISCGDCGRVFGYLVDPPSEG